MDLKQQTEDFRKGQDAYSDEPAFKRGRRMAKYIFLDFDGVLNTEQYQAGQRVGGLPTADAYGPLFDPKSVARLAEIIERTHAEVVITSSWRYVHGCGALMEMWNKRALPSTKISVLPLATGMMMSRGEEIAASGFLGGKNTSYVILDDLDDFLPEQHGHFIEVNPVTGISLKDVEKAVEILNRYDDKPTSFVPATPKTIST